MISFEKKWAFLLLILLCSPIFLTLQPTQAQQQPTLADTINNVLSEIQIADSPWNVVYGQIFGLQNSNVFDTAILKALNENSYTEVVFIARLAELNNYTSQTINNTLRTALQNIPMCGSLPITYLTNSGSSGIPNNFLVYDRYMINAYRYAQQLNVPGWNLASAFSDFTKAYLKPPEKSSYGEMLWINPTLSFSASESGRYYDEHAETLDMFLEFALNGLGANAVNFSDDAYMYTQSHWNGKYYFIMTSQK